MVSICGLFGKKRGVIIEFTTIKGLVEHRRMKAIVGVEKDNKI